MVAGSIRMSTNNLQFRENIFMKKYLMLFLLVVVALSAAAAVGRASASAPAIAEVFVAAPASGVQFSGAVTPTVALPARPATYQLQPGEYPMCIARRFNVNPDELLYINGLTQWAYTYPGQVLNIPQTGNPFPYQRALRYYPTNYTVAWGESIYKIACDFGDVDPMAIANVNRLAPPYSVYPGQLIYIPGTPSSPYGVGGPYGSTYAAAPYYYNQYYPYQYSYYNNYYYPYQYNYNYYYPYKNYYWNWNQLGPTEPPLVTEPGPVFPSPPGSGPVEPPTGG